MELYDPKTNEVQSKSGLNWGNSKGNTNPGDTYIPIRKSHIKNHPKLFPPKQVSMDLSTSIGRLQIQNHPVELVWDDGTRMEALFEGSQSFRGTDYPKQISTFQNKNLIGVYIRKRLGLSPTATVRKADLDAYGRDYISISLLSDSVYFVDFSVSK